MLSRVSKLSSGTYLGFTLAFFLVMMSGGAFAATDLNGSKVLVVYRTGGVDADKNGIADSEQLARYYAAKRNVPAANLLPVTLSVPYNYYYTGEYSKFYNDLAANTEQAYANRPDKHRCHPACRRSAFDALRRNRQGYER